ncbi:hypothetical protein BD779DRAFT_1475264 [Infundibulicybe gibba]|nr:hypothetical protein BD779DRAFT_1475264 [Infundibulicybe gibba]
MHFGGVASSFTVSVLSVQHNVVKNVIFRVSALCLQLAVYNLFSYGAFKSKAYTSFLMFAEDHIQRFFFVSSRGWSRSSLIVLGFAILSPLAGLYDTLLWSLDSPGYVIRSSQVNGSTVEDQLLTTPPYIILIANSAGNVSSINANATITGNLFKPGLNFTLPATNILGMVGDVVPARQSLADAEGPCIWLDDEGFSVGIDSSSPLPTGIYCGIVTVDDDNQAWSCSDALDGEWDRAFSASLGRPLIWWDRTQWEYLRPSRHDNPWTMLGTGGDTAAMKQIFTVTKGTRRHTFIESFLKISMASTYPHPIDSAEILEMVRRSLSNDTADNIQSATRKLANLVIAAQANHSNYMAGAFYRGDSVVSSTSIEYFTNVTNEYDKSPIYSAFRVTASNITLIRSETLPNPVTPFTPCPGKSFSNVATGGQVRGTTCYLANGTQDSGARFLGQLDTSAVLILTEVLGDGSAATSATALNETGSRWYQSHSNHMEQMLTSRGLMVGGDPGSMLVDVQHTEVALSYLQTLLSSIPVLIVIISSLLIRRDKRGYFQSSFLAAIHAAVYPDESRRDKVGYLHASPEIRLEVVGEHVMLGMRNGSVIANVARRVPFSSPAENDDIPHQTNAYHTIPMQDL